MRIKRFSSLILTVSCISMLSPGAAGPLRVDADEPGVPPDTTEVAAPIADETHANDETPHGAATLFYESLRRGDKRSALACLATPDKLDRWVHAQVQLSKAFDHLGNAAVSEFGDEGEMLRLPSPFEISILRLKTIAATQEGDHAEIPFNPKFPLKFMRRDGHWKIDLLSSFPSPSHVPSQVTYFVKMAEFLDGIASDIEAKKFDSVTAVRAEMKKRKAAMDKELNR